MQKDINLKVIIYITLAFVFGIASRYYWIYWAGGIEPFIYNGSIMINTNDGYYFAEGASDIISNYKEVGAYGARQEALAIVTALLYKITPFSLDTIMLYLSGIFSSLLVIPIIMISKELKCLEAGFVGSLVSVVAMSYYNRTMFGYYDTDMLVIVLPMFILWGMIKVAINKQEKDMIIAPICTLVGYWWYTQSLSINMALVIMFILYTFIFDRKNVLNYKTAIMILAATTNLNIFINFIVVFLLYLLFLKHLKRRYFLIISFVVVLNFIINGGASFVFSYLKTYVFRDISDTIHDQLIFFNVNNTIHELGRIDLVYFMQRISSHTILFVLSFIGYILMCFKNRAFLLSLPMVGLGFLALKGGLRFTIYAVPIMGLGLGFLYFYILGFLNINRYIKMFMLSAVTIISLIPALEHIYSYKSSTVFNSNEIKILESLREKASRDDYILAWWDYGYPLRYYTNAKTLTDGRVHSGEVNFPVSFSLSQDQMSSANMARLAVEYHEKRFNLEENEKQYVPYQNLKWMMVDYNIGNINDFILSLSLKDFKAPNKTRDIYYYLPMRMMSIFSTIVSFSNLALNTGKEKSNKVFSVGQASKKNKDGLFLDNGLFLSFDMKKLINSKGENIPIKDFYITGYLQDNKFESKKEIINENGYINVIFIANYNTFVFVDDSLLNSTFVQLFLLENYNKELFEPVILNSDAKIYKLKR